MGTATGPLLCLTPANFIEFVNLQKDTGFYWPDALDEINQFHRCNGRAEIDAEALQVHLLSFEGSHDWEFMGDQIFREMQVEAFTFDASFVIPPKFTNLVKEVRSCIDVEPYVWLEPMRPAVISDVLIEVVRLECTRPGIQPRIPEELANVFGPDEEERRRLHYRGRSQRSWLGNTAHGPANPVASDRPAQSGSVVPRGD